MQPTSRRILVSGGTSWYLWNFRRNVVSALADAGWEVLVIAPEDEHSVRLASLPSVRWINWPVTLAGANVSQEIVSLIRFAFIIKRSRPDFVINHGIKANIYGGLTCRILRIPYANNITGLGMMIARTGVGPWLLARLYAFSCGGARQLFVQNLDDLTVLRRAGLPYNVPVVRTIGSGVDLEHFAFSPLPSTAKLRNFVFVGRLQRDKGIYDFVEAARRLRNEYPGARFVAVGSGRHANREAVPGEILQQWTDEGIVEFVGSKEDVRPWIAAAHVLVLPSHGGEGVPKVLLEAAAAGRPVIASDVPGCRDAVVNRQTGFLHPPNDSDALLDAMRHIMQASGDELAAMGRAARADAEERFSDIQLVSATVALANSSMV